MSFFCVYIPTTTHLIFRNINFEKRHEFAPRTAGRDTTRERPRPTAAASGAHREVDLSSSCHSLTTSNTYASQYNNRQTIIYSLRFESVQKEQKKKGNKHKSKSIKQCTHRGSNPEKRKQRNKLEKKNIWPRFEPSSTPQQSFGATPHASSIVRSLTTHFFVLIKPANHQPRSAFLARRKSGDCGGISSRHHSRSSHCGRRRSGSISTRHRIRHAVADGLGHLPLFVAAAIVFCLSSAPCALLPRNKKSWLSFARRFLP